MGGRAVYDTLPEEVTSQLAYVPDKMILEYLLIKARFGPGFGDGGVPLQPCLL